MYIFLFDNKIFDAFDGLGEKMITSLSKKKEKGRKRWKRERKRRKKGKEKGKKIGKRK